MPARAGGAILPKQGVFAAIRSVAAVHHIDRARTKSGLQRGE
jgi:hypothetical protein